MKSNCTNVCTEVTESLSCKWQKGAKRYVGLEHTAALNSIEIIIMIIAIQTITKQLRSFFKIIFMILKKDI